MASLKLSAEVEGVTQRLGGRIHHFRRVLGLSQEQLSRLAGTSQGAVSRVESGHCPATPLVTYLRLLAAMAHQLLPLHESLTPDAKALAEFLRVILPITLEKPDFQVFADPGLASLLSAYMPMQPGDRQTFVRLVLPIADLVVERSRRSPELGDAQPTSEVHAKRR